MQSSVYFSRPVFVVCEKRLCKNCRCKFSKKTSVNITVLGTMIFFKCKVGRPYHKFWVVPSRALILRLGS